MSLIDKMTPIEREYKYEDASGYKFTVSTSFTPGHGWFSQVIFQVDGLASEKAAADHLIPAVKHFLKVAQK